MCAGVCIDFETDPRHCGGCDQVCELPNAVPRCVNGVCEIDKCAAGWADGDANASNGCECGGKEICNGLDDDCNGVTDDLGMTECLVENEYGACPGTATCTGGWGFCKGLGAMVSPST